MVSLTFEALKNEKLKADWIPVVRKLSLVCPKSVFVQDGIPQILLLAESTQENKVLACKVLELCLGALGSKLESHVLQSLKVLSVDSCWEVRLAACKVWKVYFKHGANPQVCFFEVMKLLKDSQKNIQTKALGVFLETLSEIPKELLESHALPLIENLVFKELKIEAAKHLGKLLEVVGKRFSNQTYYALIKEIKESNSKIYLAQNFHKIFKFFGHTKFTRDLIEWLCKNETKVKLAAVNSLQALPSSFQKTSAFSNIVRCFLEEEETLLMILKELKVWVKITQPSNLLKKVSKQLDSNSNWRVKFALLDKVKEVFGHFAVCEILDLLVPQLFRLANTSIWVLRQKAAKFLAYIVYRTFYTTKKKELCSNINFRLGASSSCYNRVLYLDFVSEILELHSSEFFLRHFAERTLTLCKDSTHSVRFKASTMLLQIRGALFGFSEIKFKKVLNSLCSDPYKSIREKALEFKSYMFTEEFQAYLRTKQTQEEKKLQFEATQQIQEQAYNDETKKKTGNSTETTQSTKKLFTKRKVLRTRFNKFAPSPRVQFKSRSVPLIKTPVNKK